MKGERLSAWRVLRMVLLFKSGVDKFLNSE